MFFFNRPKIKNSKNHNKIQSSTPTAQINQLQNNSIVQKTNICYSLNSIFKNTFVSQFLNRNKSIICRQNRTSLKNNKLIINVHKK